MESRGAFFCCDMKSFYASVECVARGLDPLTARLLVADDSRTDKTIVLAVSPALKAIGVPGRPRLFEAKQKIREYRSANSLTDTDVIDRELLESLGLSDPATLKKVQEFLTGEGYDLGTPDGLIGSKTRAAVQNYKEGHGLEANGMIDQAFLESIGLDW